MAAEEEDPIKAAEKRAKINLFEFAKQWGDSPLPPTLLATLIFPQHARPLQPVPLLFPPDLLFCSYLNLQGFKTDAAGTTAAWSGLYMLMAARRKHRVREWFGPRGLLRGATMAVAAANLVGCGMAYMFGRRSREERKP